MKKTIVISLVFSLLATSLRAGDFRFAYGLEWGLAPTVYTYENNAFFTEEQFPVRTTSHQITYNTNGYIWAAAGVEWRRKLNLSVYAGYQGTGPGYRAYPLVLRGTWFFTNSASNGVFASGGGGFLFDEKFSLKTGYTANILSGYRIMIGKKLSMDLKLGIQISMTYPSAFTDRYMQTVVTADRVIYAKALRGAVIAGISLNL